MLSKQIKSTTRANFRPAWNNAIPLMTKEELLHVLVQVMFDKSPNIIWLRKEINKELEKRRGVSMPRYMGARIPLVIDPKVHQSI